MPQRTPLPSNKLGLMSVPSKSFIHVSKTRQDKGLLSLDAGGYRPFVAVYRG